METDLTSTPRYPYLTSYLHNRYGTNVDPKYDWWFYHFPRRSEYWDLIHKSGKYYDRLDPTYLSRYSKFNSFNDYAPNPRNFRLENPEMFGLGEREPKKDPERSAYENWLESKYNHLPRKDRLDLLERFYRDRYSQARLKNAMGGTYLPPSKLYDNPHYKEIGLKDYRRGRYASNTVADSKVTQLDELVYILAEIIKMDIEYYNLREFFTRRHDFDPEEIMSYVPNNENTDYLNENDFIKFCRKLDIFPSQEELNLFFERFGSSEHRIKIKSFKRLLFGDSAFKNNRLSTKRMSIDTVGELSLFMKRLLSNLCHQNYLKKRFGDRNKDIDAAFEKLADGATTIDDTKLRDEFFKANLVIPIEDVQRLLRELSEDQSCFVTRDKLVRFLRARA